MAWFFKKAAFFLLFGIFGAADRHVILFTIIGLRTTHLECLLQTVGRPGIFATINVDSINNYFTQFLAWYKEQKSCQLPKWLHIFYFTNKCGGLAKMDVRWAKRIKSKIDQLVNPLTYLTGLGCKIFSPPGCTVSAKRYFGLNFSVNLIMLSLIPRIRQIFPL